MSKPLSTLPNPVESNANFVSALARIGAEVDHQPLRSSALARIMRETFHGSDAGGAWDWRMAYARYHPQRIEIAGAQEHPTRLVESIAMASVAPPR